MTKKQTEIFKFQTIKSLNLNRCKLKNIESYGDSEVICYMIYVLKKFQEEELSYRHKIISNNKLREKEKQYAR